MRFYVVFGVVVFLTVLSGASAISIALQVDVSANPGAKSLMDTSSFLFAAGMGTILGLLSGAKRTDRG